VVAADGWVVADEVYSRFVYDGRATHLRAVPGMRERCVTALGPSKTESASGFRIGVLVAPPELVDAVTEVVEITTVRAPAYAQYALARWMDRDDEFVRGRVAAYRRLRDLTVARLSEVEGLGVGEPAATAWLFPSIAGLGRSEREVIEALIRRGVLVMPGSSFGPAGAGHVRMCFGQDEAGWPAVLDRMVDTFDGLRR
jgi:aspartate/methionine/tyrosine aminotransferase